MTEISREFNVDTNDWPTFQAASQLMIATAGIIMEHDLPEQLRLEHHPDKGVNRYDNTVIRRPEGHVPIFVATKTKPYVYRIQAKLPLPASVRSANGVNAANYHIQLSSRGAGGGFITFQGGVRRIGPEYVRTKASSVLNGLAHTLNDLHVRGLPIFGYRSHFQAVNCGEDTENITRYR